MEKDTEIRLKKMRFPMCVYGDFCFLVDDKKRILPKSHILDLEAVEQLEEKHLQSVRESLRIPINWLPKEGQKITFEESAFLTFKNILSYSKKFLLEDEINVERVLNWDNLLGAVRDIMGCVFTLSYSESSREVFNWFDEQIKIGNLIPLENYEKEREQFEKNLRELNNERAATNKIIQNLKTKLKHTKLKINEDDILRYIDDCRKKNGKINYSELGRKLGVSYHTAKRYFKIYGIK